MSEFDDAFELILRRAPTTFMQYGNHANIVMVQPKEGPEAMCLLHFENQEEKAVVQGHLLAAFAQIDPDFGFVE